MIAAATPYSRPRRPGTVRPTKRQTRKRTRRRVRLKFLRRLHDGAPWRLPASKGEEARLVIMFSKFELSLYRSGRAISSTENHPQSGTHDEPTQIVSLSNLVRASPSWKRKDIAHILSSPTLQIVMERPALKVSALQHQSLVAPTFWSKIHATWPT